MKAFHVIIVVWGREFIQSFLDITLPNWLSPHNLPEASRQFALHGKVYTRKEDEKLLSSHPVFQRLAHLFPVDIIPLIPEVIDNKYQAMSDCQLHSWHEAKKQKAAIIFTSPDVIIADGGFVKGCSLIATGYKIVAHASLNRGSKESISSELKKNYLDDKNHAINISNRDLIELSLKHLHPDSSPYFWDNEQASLWPSHVYWRSNSNSILAKFFHIHPFIIDVENIDPGFDPLSNLKDGNTIDGVLIGATKCQAKDIYVITSSDEIAIVELTSITSQFPPTQKPTWKAFQMARIAQRCFLPLHRDHFLQFHFRYQGHGEIDWKKLEKKAMRDLICYRILIRAMLFARPYIVKAKQLLLISKKRN